MTDRGEYDPGREWLDQHCREQEHLDHIREEAARKNREGLLSVLDESNKPIIETLERVKEDISVLAKEQVSQKRFNRRTTLWLIGIGLITVGLAIASFIRGCGSAERPWATSDAQAAPGELSHYD